MTAPRTYADALRSELGAVGISGRLRVRIVTEIEDHLACEPDAQSDAQSEGQSDAFEARLGASEARLGPPELLARQFADELGTLRTRRAALRGFAALALAGLLFFAAFVGAPAAAFGAAPNGASLLGRIARLVAILAPQVAFVAGLLAALRTVRRRGSAVIVAAEARIIVRRAIVGTVAGLATTVSLGGIALAFRHQVRPGWYTFALVASGVGAAALLAVLPSLLAATQVRPVAAGGSGDLFDDLGPVVPRMLRARPWRLAVSIAAGVAIAIAIAGGAGDDLYDGIARGIADGLVCLLGFATLGRYLGLWSPGSAGGAAAER